MTDKEKDNLIQELLSDKRKYELSIQVLEARIRCEREHLETIDHVLDNLEN
jgi:hypothetical protein